MFGDGIRPRWTAEPGLNRPQNPSQRLGRLGHPDRARYELPAQRGSDLAYSPRPKVIQW